MKILRYILFISAILAGCPAASAQSRPEIFDRPSHDFGALSRGESRQAAFTVVNRGGAPLLLTDVRTTCRCLRIDWPRRPLAPGESGTITATFRSRDRGTFYREITVHTSASQQPYSLFVRGIVE
jgi:uncharacterized protein (DUF58 family)